MRVMMLGPFPRSPERIDGGVAAAMMYLARELISEPGIDLIGVRVAPGEVASEEASTFDWPIANLPLDRGSVSSFFLRQRRRFAEMLREFKPDIVHAHGVDLSGALAVRSGRPSVVTVHGLLAECARYQSNLVVMARDRLQGVMTEGPTIRHAKNLIVINPYVAQYYGNAIRARTYEIPNAVSREFFRVKRAPEQGRLLFAGRIAKGKGILELVKAVKLSGDAVRKVVLAGSTPDKEYENSVRRSIVDSGLAGRIEFAGLLNESALIDEFARAEALVLPSYQETAPMVVQQAMAAGIAVIASRVGGIPFMIDHDVTGLLFNPVDPRQMGNLFCRLRAEPGLSDSLGREAKAVASVRFDSRTVARATRRAYEAILS